MKQSKIVSILLAVIMMFSGVSVTSVHAAEVTPKNKLETKMTINVDIPDLLGNGYLPFTKEIPTGVLPFGIVGTYMKETLQNNKTPIDANQFLTIQITA